MVEVVTITQDGILETVEVYKHKSKAAQMRKQWILGTYGSINAYNQALENSDANPLVQHWTNLEVE